MLQVLFYVQGALNSPNAWNLLAPYRKEELCTRRGRPFIYTGWFIRGVKYINNYVMFLDMKPLVCKIHNDCMFQHKHQTTLSFINISQK